jgi:transcriptional regulator PpsR
VADTLTDRTLRKLSSLELLRASSDIALLLDGDGQVLDCAIGDAALAKSLQGQLLGRRLEDTVTEETRGKVSDLLEDAKHGAAPRWRQVNHQQDDQRSPDHPVRYCALRLDGGKRVLAIGRDLQLIADLQQQLISAQEASERDFWRLRQSESRFRLLFQVSNDPVLVVDADSERVLEVNPAAEAMLGPERKVGRMAGLLHKEQEQELRMLFARAGSAGTATAEGFRLRGTNQPLDMKVSALRQGNTSIYLVILVPPGQVNRGRDSQVERALRMIDRAPDGIVICDGGGSVLYCNPHFVELAQLPGADHALGHSLGTWLGRSAVDVNVLIANVRKNGTVRHYATTLRGALDVSAAVEVSGCSLGDEDDEETPSSYGFVIRSTEQRRSEGAEVIRMQSVDQLTDLVGKVPLKELVRESADLIERLSIEAALTLTNNNRAAAAEMLGLSRQSLYVKLRRYGIGEGAQD